MNLLLSLQFLHRLWLDHYLNYQFLVLWLLHHQHQLHLILNLYHHRLFLEQGLYLEYFHFPSVFPTVP